MPKDKEQTLRSSSDFYTDFNNNARSSKSLGFQQINHTKDIVYDNSQFESLSKKENTHKKSMSFQLQYELLSDAKG